MECECEGATQPPRGLLADACQGGAGVTSGTAWGLGAEASDDVSSDSITPELAALPDSGPPKLFPVFRRKAEWKVCAQAVQHRSAVQA